MSGTQLWWCWSSALVDSLDFTRIYRLQSFPYPKALLAQHLCVLQYNECANGSRCRAVAWSIRASHLIVPKRTISPLSKFAAIGFPGQTQFDICSSGDISTLQIGDQISLTVARHWLIADFVAKTRLPVARCPSSTAFISGVWPTLTIAQVVNIGGIANLTLPRAA